MKKMKRFVSLLLTVVMVLAMGMTSFAEGTQHSITITNTNSTISIAGKTYYAYKLFDSTHVGDAYAYTMSTDNQFYSADLVATTDPTAGTLAALLRNYFTFTAVTGDSTKVNVAPKDNFETESNARAFADAIQQFLAGKTATASATATGETATIVLPNDAAGVGYYIVTGEAAPTDPNSEETVVSAVIITNEDPDANIQPKAGIPTLDKKITGVAEGTTTVDGAVLDAAGQAAVAKVGSKVSYEIDSITPDLRGYSDYTFVISDAITDGLDYVEDSFVLKIGNGDEAAEVDIDPEFAADKRSFTLTIPYETLDEYLAGTAIVLTYDATVNADSLVYDYVNNTAKLTYSNSPYTKDTNDTPDKKTYVININLDVDKVAPSTEGSDGSKVPGEKLAGAEFILYRLVNSTEQYYKWDEKNDTDEKNDAVTWVAKANADKFTTDATGALTQQIRGLDKGTYYLVETKAPTGYNLLQNPVVITISVKEVGNKVTYEATVDGTAKTVDKGEIDLTAAQNANQPVVIPTIENSTGTILPSTGGIGTTIFYVLGAILVLAAGVILVTRRRMSMNE